ncbi:MAG: glutathione S-transferase family protein [Proteobacteria bacterium]|nr:glutathione S-transferase family protein [Pseudomonadota bacterium]
MRPEPLSARWTPRFRRRRVRRPERLDVRRGPCHHVVVDPTNSAAAWATPWRRCLTRRPKTVNEPPALTLHFHPLASYCWKVLLALYEAGTPFRTIQIDGVPKENEAYAHLWPMAKMPLLQDGDRTVPESSIIIEYLDVHHRGSVALIPDDADAAREVRLWDRFFDLYVHAPMQKCVSDRLRPEGAQDAVGVEEARATLDTAYAMLDRRMAARTWAAGDTFSMADCAALPPLFYADAVHPYRATHPALAGYFERLVTRPSAQRVLREAQPWLQYFPFAHALDPRFLAPPVV